MGRQVEVHHYCGHLARIPLTPPSLFALLCPPSPPADDMGRQVAAHHYCSHPSEEVRQCCLFDSDQKGGLGLGGWGWGWA